MTRKQQQLQLARKIQDNDIVYLFPYLLKVAHLVSGINKMSSLSKKKVWTPVAMTTASISPCLQVEPEYTPSPAPFVTGRDSPVSADCKNPKSFIICNLTVANFVKRMFPWFEPVAKRSKLVNCTKLNYSYRLKNSTGNESLNNSPLIPDYGFLLLSIT